MAKVIICIGSIARSALQEHMDLFEDRYVIFLPHPNAFMKKRITDILKKDEILCVREFLKDNSSSLVVVEEEFENVLFASELKVIDFIVKNTFKVRNRRT